MLLVLYVKARADVQAREDVEEAQRRSPSARTRWTRRRRAARSSSSDHPERYEALGNECLSFRCATHALLRAVTWVQRKRDEATSATSALTSQHSQLRLETFTARGSKQVSAHKSCYARCTSTCSPATCATLQYYSCRTLRMRCATSSSRSIDNCARHRAFLLSLAVLLPMLSLHVLSLLQDVHGTPKAVCRRATDLQERARLEADRVDEERWEVLRS